MPKRLVIGIGLLWICASCLALGYELIQKPKLVIQWTTETEINTAGYNLYRSDRQDGQFERLNKTLIQGSDDPLAGGEYMFTDEDVEAGEVYYYQLEEVETNGVVNKVEVIQGVAPGKKVWILALSIAGSIFGITLMVWGVRINAGEPSKESTRYP